MGKQKRKLFASVELKEAVGECGSGLYVEDLARTLALLSSRKLSLQLPSIKHYTSHVL